jgi:hypothetical protein
MLRYKNLALARFPKTGTFFSFQIIMPQQTTLNLPKTRRNTKQQQVKNKSIDENVIQIGKVDSIKTNKLESAYFQKW